jgi:hypothetical protein
LGDALDVYLDSGLPVGRKSMGFLKGAYDCGTQTFVNRSITDKLLEESGHAFHIGTDDPTMRRIASWLLTYHLKRCNELIERLWKRNGREDVKLAGLLIANMEDNPWEKFLSLLRNKEPLEVVLDVAEEIKRSGRDIPSKSFLQKWASNDIRHQIVMLICSLQMKDDLRGLVESAPEGGELFERIRERALAA